jgi:parallel beta-helix repeat protein
VYLDSVNSQWNTITGNSFSWSTANEHIIIVLGKDNAVIGNTIHGAWTHGIVLDGAQFNTVNGNTIFDSGRAANNTYVDILLRKNGTTPALNNIVQGNIIRATATASVNKTAYCIQELEEDEDGNIIRNNQVTGAVTQNIHTRGRTTIERDNIGQNKLILDNAFLETAYWSASIFNSGTPSVVGALLRRFDNLTIRSANTATSNTDVTGWGDASDPNNKMDFGKRPRFRFRAKIQQIISQEIFLVMGDLGTLFQKYAGFKIVNGVLSAVNANGTVETATDISVGITLTNWNEYDVVVFSGKVLFYVNGTLKATHTTNVPAGLDDLAYIEMSVTSNDAAAKFVDVKDMYFEIYL